MNPNSPEPEPWWFTVELIAIIGVVTALVIFLAMKMDRDGRRERRRYRPNRD